MRTVIAIPCQTEYSLLELRIKTNSEFRKTFRVLLMPLSVTSLIVFVDISSLPPCTLSFGLIPWFNNPQVPHAVNVNLRPVWPHSTQHISSFTQSALSDMNFGTISAAM